MHLTNLKHQKRKININIFNWRFIFFYICLFLMLIGLMWRIAYLQIIDNHHLLFQSNIRSLRLEQISMLRGTIRDRNGRLLAISVPVDAVFADPKELNDNKRFINNIFWKAFANILSIPLNQLFLRINTKPTKRFIYLARQVNKTVSNYIYKLKLPGIYLNQESRRYYPTGEIFAQIIGTTNIDGYGIEGIEKSFDSWLSGKPGKRIVRKDKFGRVIENIAITNSEEPKNLTLSIDERLQTLAYKELKNAVMLNQAESGTVVLIDINTGEILVMVNSPSYNPNNLKNVTICNMRNRAITDLFEPGSTVKPMVIMTALQYGIIKKHSVLNTLPYVVNGYKIKDTVYHNRLSITDILQKSSNVGVSKLALAMPFSAILNTYSNFGLGKPTNLGLIGESSGFLPYKRRCLSDIEKATFSYGYGLMVTPLQLARVYATIGSMGILRPLSILKVNSPITGKRVFSEQFVRMVIHMMKIVPLANKSNSQFVMKNYCFAIKTGTVKKVAPNGKYVNKYIAYTAGVAPANKPRFALAVVINNPCGTQYYGGMVSAPVFEAIMTNTLRIMHTESDILPDIISKNLK